MLKKQKFFIFKFKQKIIKYLENNFKISYPSFQYLQEETQRILNLGKGFDEFHSLVNYVYYSYLNPNKIRSIKETRIQVLANLTNHSTGKKVEKVLNVDTGCNINLVLSGQSTELGLTKENGSKVIGLASGKIQKRRKFCCRY